MKHWTLLLGLVLLAPYARAQSEAQTEDTVTLRAAAEHERIRQERDREQAQFAVLEKQCYTRFAVNDCLIEVRARRREVLGDLRRQEISLNDAQRKRRAAEQILRSDARSANGP